MRPEDFFTIDIKTYTKKVIGMTNNAPLTIEQLRVLEQGYLINADDISKISGQNRVKGIHPIESQGFKAVAILCSIGGENYPNEWPDASKNTLKYYLEGRTDRATGRKKYNRNLKTNRWVVDSRNEDFPLLVFARNKKGDLFWYEGLFLYESIRVTEGNDQYFVLKRKDIDITIPELIEAELENATVSIEGKRVIRNHLSRERDPRIIKLAIQNAKRRYGKVICEVCGFDFEKRYGSRGKDFIEGHHKNPISESNGQVQTKVEDIALLCSNCHRMIHRQKPWLSI